jgi:transposase
VAIHACLEASGGYEQPVARWLYRQGATVSVINPSRTSAYADSQLRRSKTDAVDARILARFCQREEPASWQPPTPDQEALREMSRGLEGLKKERDRLRNQLDHASHDAVTDALDAVLDRVCEQIDALERRINEHIRACKALAQKQELLETIPGIGATTATQVIAELGSAERFKSARQAATYAGLTPAHHESGTSIQRRPRFGANPVRWTFLH